MTTATPNSMPSPRSRHCLANGRWTFLVVAALLGADESSAQVPVFNSQNGHWYAAIPGVTSWAEARQAAEVLGGYLVTLTSIEEQTFVANAFPDARRDGYWLGGFQAANEADPLAGWAWVTGEPWSFTHWLPGGEPNDFGGVNEDRLAFHAYINDNPQGYWNDVQPFNSPGFVVEWERYDSDGDGWKDDEDPCPHSDLAETVRIDGCDSGVPNPFLAPGCTLADRIAECAAAASNHDEFVSCVARLTNASMKAGLIGAKAKGSIQSCAGQSSLP